MNSKWNQSSQLCKQTNGKGKYPKGDKGKVMLRKLPRVEKTRGRHNLLLFVYREARSKPLCKSEASKCNGLTPSSIRFNKALVKATMLHLLSIWGPNLTSGTSPSSDRKYGWMPWPVINENKKGQMPFWATPVQIQHKHIKISENDTRFAPSTTNCPSLSKHKPSATAGLSWIRWRCTEMRSGTSGHLLLCAPSEVDDPWPNGQWTLMGTSVCLSSPARGHNNMDHNRSALYSFHQIMVEALGINLQVWEHARPPVATGKENPGNF